MKLNKEQVSKIDTILEKSGVVYIDYKYEILDHIATEVEQLMEETDRDFEYAFTLILEKWNPKLKKSSSTLFGYLWEIPEILMQKAKKLYWQKTIVLIITSFVLCPILYFAKDFIPKIFDAIWYFFIGILIFQCIGYIQIRRSKLKTTFGFLYKQQFLAFLFLYFLQLYTLDSLELKFENSKWDAYLGILMISILLIAPIFSFLFHKKHFNHFKSNTKFSN